MMKKLLTILLCCLLLTACAQTQTVPAASNTEPPVTNAPTQTPTDVPTEAAIQSFTLYYGDENAENFLSEEVQVAQINETVVMEHLIAAGVLPEGAAVNSLTMDGAQLNIDLNEAFRNCLFTMGTAGEHILIGSVVNTFLSAYKAECVMLTVDGEILESGHAVYDFPIEFIN